MRKCLLVAAALVMLSGVAQAAAWNGTGTGGYVYWNTDNAIKTTPWPIKINRAEFDCAMAVIANPAVIDCVSNEDPRPGHGGLWHNYNLEVYDPRHYGGTGRLLVVADTDADGASDVVRETPSTKAQSTVVFGRVSGLGGWYTDETTIVAHAVSEGYAGKTTNGIAVMDMTWGRATTAGYHYDANGGGFADASLNEEQDVAGPANQATEYEYAQSDRSMFTLLSSPPPSIKRTKEGGGAVDYYTFGTGAFNNLILGKGDGMAVRSSPNQYTAPMVYVMGGNKSKIDCDTGQPTFSIWAFQDTNNDNVITAADATPVSVWDKWTFGWGDAPNGGNNSMPDWYAPESYAYPDLEYDPVSNSLMLNSPWGGFWIVGLNAAGTSATVGKIIANAGGGWGPTGGFELDMTQGAAIPEPGTLLLIGTGLIGALGYARRRIVKK